jgi:predicted enzyme related to lactoylglutathione lyase
MTAPVVHFEIGVRDVAQAQKFYGPLLGWEFTPYGGAAMIANLGPMAGTPGIGGHVNSLGHPPHNYCVVYAQVDDLAATISRAEQLGDRQLVPPTEVPGMGHFAWLADPEGNAFGLRKPLAK